MIEKIIGKYNITVEQFMELVDDLEDNHKRLYNNHIDDLEKITMEYKILSSNSESDLQELEAKEYTPKLAEVIKTIKQLHIDLASNQRKRLELIERDLEIVVENIININEGALDKLCEQL